MQTVHDLAVRRRYFTEAWNPRNLAALDDLFPPTFTLVVPGGEGAARCPSPRRQTRIECWHEGFDGYRYDIDHEAVTEDGTVLFFTTFSGTHTGRFQWLGYGPWEPTGRRDRLLGDVRLRRRRRTDHTVGGALGPGELRPPARRRALARRRAGYLQVH